MDYLVVSIDKEVVNSVSRIMDGRLQRSNLYCGILLDVLLIGDNPAWVIFYDEEEIINLVIKREAVIGPDILELEN